MIKALATELANPASMPAAINPSIVNKVFELIPYPVQSSAGRYGYANNRSNFMLMFDEDLRLQMDAVGQVDDGVVTPHFAIDGTYPFGLHRDDNGDVTQNPMIAGSKPVAPPNTFQADNIHLIASFADLENSSELRGDPFVVIFSPTMKRNSADSNLNYS